LDNNSIRNNQRINNINNIFSSNQFKNSIKTSNKDDSRVNKVTNSTIDYEQARRLNSTPKQPINKFKHIIQGKKVCFV
jgi:hypothetical protein